MNDFKYTPILPLGKDKTKYKKITEDFVKIKNIDGKNFTILDLKLLELHLFPLALQNQFY